MSISYLLLRTRLYAIDFIIKTVARKKITTDAPEVIIAEIKRKIVELEEYIKKYQRLETTER